MSAATSFRLTTVRQDVGTLAREVVERLIERMADPAIPARSQVVPVELIARHSSAR
jgi:DNA-binding LacI/PurR family transcriptional regulator